MPAGRLSALCADTTSSSAGSVRAPAAAPPAGPTRAPRPASGPARTRSPIKTIRRSRKTRTRRTKRRIRSRVVAFSQTCAIASLPSAETYELALATRRIRTPTVAGVPRKQRSPGEPPPWSWASLYLTGSRASPVRARQRSPRNVSNPGLRTTPRSTQELGSNAQIPLAISKSESSPLGCGR